MILYAGYFLLIALLLGTTGQTRPEADPTPLGIPYQRYMVKDSFDRTITFYLSLPSKNENKQPIALFIQGSGCQSLFRKQAEKVTGGYQNILLQVARGRVRILVVEKPGVKFLDTPSRPGSAES